MSDANDIKTAVCEYLLSLNRDSKGVPLEPPFIPPTAINWIGDGLVGAILPLVNTDKDVEVVRVERFESRCWCGWSQLHVSAEAAAKDAARHEREWHTLVDTTLIRPDK